MGKTVRQKLVQIITDYAEIDVDIMKLNGNYDVSSICDYKLSNS